MNDTPPLKPSDLRRNDDPPETPECDRLAREHTTRLVLESFVRWLAENEMEIAHINGDYLMKRPDQLVMMYLDIDEKKLEAERRALIEYQHKMVNSR